MNQNEYLQIIDEMTIPASKILYWTNIIKSEYQEIYIDITNLFRSFSMKLCLPHRNL